MLTHRIGGLENMLKKLKDDDLIDEEYPILNPIQSKKEINISLRPALILDRTQRMKESNVRTRRTLIEKAKAKINKKKQDIIDI